MQGILKLLFLSARHIEEVEMKYIYTLTGSNESRILHGKSRSMCANAETQAFYTSACKQPVSLAAAAYLGGRSGNHPASHFWKTPSSQQSLAIRLLKTS